LKKILFIAHDASRTGAPKVLLEFLKKLSQETDYSFDVVFRKGGPLISEFEKISTCYLWSRTHAIPEILKELFVKGSFKKQILNREKHRFINSVKKHKYDLIYVNSVLSADVLIELTDHIKTPVIQHVHELEYMIRTFCDPTAFIKSIKRTSKFIAVSWIVKNNLINNHSIDENDIELVHEFIPDEIKVRQSSEQIRSELNIGESDFVVVSSGTVDLRKGTDLFVQIARSCLKTSKLKFVWVGGDLTSREYFLYRQDIQKLRLENDVIITGNVDNPYDYYNAADIFLMPSREDPFPLVCLEAARLKKPIVCFEDAIGSTEFINNENGGVVPYLDIHAASEEILKLQQNPELIKTKGEAIYLASEHYHLKNAFDRIVGILTSVNSSKD